MLLAIVVHKKKTVDDDDKLESSKKKKANRGEFHGNCVIGNCSFYCSPRIMALIKSFVFSSLPLQKAQRKREDASEKLSHINLELLPLRVL